MKNFFSTKTFLLWPLSVYYGCYFTDKCMFECQFCRLEMADFTTDRLTDLVTCGDNALK